MIRYNNPVTSRGRQILMVVPICMVLVLVSVVASGQSSEWLFYENFSGSYPGDWTVDNGGSAYGWGWYPGAAYGYCYTDVVGEQHLFYPDNLQTYMSRGVLLEQYTSAVLYFYWFVDTEETFDELSVHLKPSSDNNWREIFRKSGNDTTGGSWTLETIDLSEFDGLWIEIEIRFDSDITISGVSHGYEGASIGNIVVEATPCMSEPDPGLDNIGHDTGTIDAGASFEVGYTASSLCNDPAPPCLIAFWLSSDQVLSTSTDYYIDSEWAPEIPAGGSHSYNWITNLPSETPAGSYWVLGDIVCQYNEWEGNNLAVGPSQITVSNGGCSIPTTPNLYTDLLAGVGADYYVYWDATSPDAWYELDESMTSDFTYGTIYTVNDATYKIFNKQVTGNYYYRVRSLDSCGGQTYSSGWSNTSSVQVSHCAVYQGSMVQSEMYTPADGATGVETQPTFSWQCVENSWGTGVVYNVRVSGSGINGNYTTVCETSLEYCVPSPPLSPGTLYWVHVFGYDGYGAMISDTPYHSFTTVSGANQIFVDSFESGNTSAWSQTVSSLLLLLPSPPTAEPENF